MLSGIDKQGVDNDVGWWSKDLSRCEGYLVCCYADLRRGNDKDAKPRGNRRKRISRKV